MGCKASVLYPVVCMVALPLTRFERILFRLALLLASTLLVFRVGTMILVFYMHQAR